MRRWAAVAVCVWAAGIVLTEGLAQGGASLCLLLAGVGVARALKRIPRDVRWLGGVTLTLTAWQAVSPWVAQLRGVVAGLPPSLRYGQFLDTLAPASLGVVASLETVPFAALAWILGGGWGLSAALGLYQHLVLWHWGQVPYMRTPVARVTESFSAEGPRRYAAGGFLFHRLRFAHGAVALLGPALALAVGGRSDGDRRQRLLAALASGVLLACIYMAFARAALLAAIILVVAAVLALGRGWVRRGALMAALILTATVALSPSWRTRLLRAEENVESGERHLAMTAGLVVARAHPLLGVGFGNHRTAVRALAASTGINDFLATDSHNLWLTTWVETGVPGLALTATFHLLLFAALWRRARAGSLLASGALLSLGGFHTLSLVHYLPYHTGVYLTFAFVWGLGLADVTRLPPARREVPPESDVARPPAPRP